MASERIMSTINDGGPAFPCGPLGDTFTGEDGYTRHQFPGCSGMSLRDWFAGQALAGILAADSSTQSIGFVEATDLALGYADAMLKAREEKQ